MLVTLALQCSVLNCNGLLLLYAGASIHMGQGGHVPPNYSNISYFLSMQYFLDKLKELLVFLVFSRLVQGVVGTL